MSSLKNKVSLIGRLGMQPEITTFEKGSLARFTLATNESYKDKNGTWQENTQWHTIKAWGPLAEKAQKMLTKGQEIILEGRLAHQSYETKTGEKRNETSIEITEFLLLAPRNGSEQKSENAVGTAGKSN